MERTIKKILFTTDLSENAHEVYKQTIYLAEAFRASVTILHVIEDIPKSTEALIKLELGEEAYQKLEKERGSSARQTLIGKQKEAPLIEQALHRLSVNSGDGGESTTVKIDKVVVTIGKVEDEILNHADHNDCDLIVMGHRPRGTISEALMGSIVRSVIRRSKKQIFLIPTAT